MFVKKHDAQSCMRIVAQRTSNVYECALAEKYLLKFIDGEM